MYVRLLLSAEHYVLYHCTYQPLRVIWVIVVLLESLVSMVLTEHLAARDPLERLVHLASMDQRDPLGGTVKLVGKEHQEITEIQDPLDRMVCVCPLYHAS